MIFKIKHAALPISLFLTGCGFLGSADDWNIPISPGRYYNALGLTTHTRDSASQYQDFMANGHWQLVNVLEPPDTVAGNWYLTRNPKKLWARLINHGHIYYTDFVRNITDTSFETCSYSFPICFGECSGPAPNDTANQCYNYTKLDTISVWDLYVK